jgi:Domain of unknown function (DUF4276)
MRILILGEGPTDLGRIEADGTLQLEGVLPILVRKLIGEAPDKKPVELKAKILGKVRRFPDSSRRMGRSQYGYANKLRATLGLKEGREADAIVAVVDRDGKENKDKIVELNKGRNELRQENKTCAVGLAIETIEAWLLADENALRSALGAPAIQRQPDPETLAGHDNDSEQHPKGRLQRLIAQTQSHGIPCDFTAHYANIARNLATQVLEKRCSEGFRPFAFQVRELANPQ